jgi:enoyl-CoA hydratase/carnithine racemase
MTTAQIRGEKKGPIFNIILNRPEKRNAISAEMMQGICHLAEAQLADPEIRAIILKAEGPIFSAGIDFFALGSEVGPMMGEADGGGARLRALIHQYQQYMNRLEAVELPIICAMHGKVLGMGTEIALACDLRLMSQECRWGLPELRLGLIADLGGTSRLTRIVGQTRAMEILMTGNEFSADQALAWGLVNDAPAAEGLVAAAEKLAADIVRCAPLAVGATKKVLKRGEGVDLMTQLDMEVNLQSILLRTDDCQEGLTALMEKRPPDWKRR